MRKIILWMSCLIMSFYFITANAMVEPYYPYDINVTLPVVSKDPHPLYGSRLAVGYQPSSLLWDRTRIFFDASYGYWWVPHASANKNISIYSLAPILRSYFMPPNAYASPFVELSVGVSYLSRTRIENRNLGMRFSFQDQIGLGLALGVDKQFSILLGALHYSNAHLSEHNSGITIPLILSVNYRF